MNALDAALEKLRAEKFRVERAEFPPPPLPGLWLIEETEMTERQVIDFAAKSGE